MVHYDTATHDMIYTHIFKEHNNSHKLPSKSPRPPDADAVYETTTSSNDVIPDDVIVVSRSVSK